MRRLFRRLRADTRGISAVEFAFIAPIFVLLIVGIAQMGHLFYAHAGLRNAVGEGARYATIFPRPTTQQIVDRINASRATLDTGRFTTPTVEFQQDATSRNWFADIGMSYRVSLDFLFFTTPEITLSYTRRTYVHAPPPAPPATT